MLHCFSLFSAVSVLEPSAAMAVGNKLLRVRAGRGGRFRLRGLVLSFLGLAFCPATLFREKKRNFTLLDCQIAIFHWSCTAHLTVL